MTWWTQPKTSPNWWTTHVTSPDRIFIGDHVWVGGGARILDGVSIGEKAVVAAGAVVSKDVPAHAIIGGVPAKVLRMRK